MFKFYKFKKELRYYFYDHPIQDKILKNIFWIFVTALSGLIFAFGFNCFIQPNFSAMPSVDVSEVTIKHLASCGASGLSQSLCIILKLFSFEWISDPVHYNIFYWGFYLAINVPLFFIGFFKVGKRFAIYSLINVGFSSLFGMLLKSNDPSFFINQIGAKLAHETVARVIFAGIFTGLASSLAYLINTTAGGTDLIAFFISEKKSVLVGKWSALLNLIVVSIYSILSTIPLNEAIFPKDGNFGSIDIVTALIILLFTVLYMFFVAFVVDAINTKNKKYQLNIITPNVSLSQTIMAAVPRGCTIIEGKGGYTGKKTYIIQISLRKSEAKYVTKLVRSVDQDAFINVFEMKQVYGHFFKNPIE